MSTNTQTPYPGAPQQPYPEMNKGPAPKQKNTLGIIALVLAIVGFIFACIPGALIIGWILLPIAFILSLVSLFQRGKKQWPGFTALALSILGVIVGVGVFFVVVSDAVDEALPDTEVSLEDSGENGEQASGDDAGTRSNPHPLGSTVASDGWSVTINSVDLDANEAITAENMFNEPAPEGMTYIMVNATITYTGDSDEGEMPWTTIEYVTVDGNTISQSGVTPDPLDTVSDLYPGGSTTGNVSLVVPSDTASEGVLAVAPGMLSDNAYFAVS
ncbi:MAG TPA: hypothetical protein H9870_07780 [Candidatus Corynebacterium avicola]|uniref:DUF4352 domain-containing protein n=1 Tax=Candidatus Corynebacterium avicola TaxID=2838527 RepID=A0A9D1ULB2_9CORY|nr:hypothetical protein [Candidatus Corynebacterium avicola]